MVKSVLSVHHQGLKDWIIQRLSALIMAIYTLGLIGYFVCHPNLTYADWHHLFSQNWMKVITILFILSLLFHTWIGVWTIFTDYVKSSPLRAGLNSLVLFLLFACFFWALLILWSV